MRGFSDMPNTNWTSCLASSGSGVVARDWMMRWRMFLSPWVRALLNSSSKGVLPPPAEAGKCGV